MKQLYFLILSFAFPFICQAQTLDPLWLKQIASAQSGGGISFDESVDLIETDSEGNVYVAGFMQVNGQVDTVATNPMPGNSFTYLVKFNCTGEYQWHKQFGNNTGGGSPISLVLTDSLVGICLGYGSSPSNSYVVDSDTIITDSPTSGRGGLLVVYNNSGVFKWQWGSGTDYLTGVFPNLNSFIFDTKGGFTHSLTGNWYGLSESDSGNLGGMPINSKGTYLTKITPSGLLDTVYMIYPKKLNLYQIEYLSENELLIYFGASYPFYAAGDTFTSGGGNFLAKIDTLGNFYWANNANHILHGLSLTNDGNILAAGEGINSIFFGLTKTTNGAHVGKIDANTGQAVWLIEAREIGAGMGSGPVCQKSDGRIYWAGGVYDRGAFGPDTIMSNGGYDVFISELDEFGDYIKTEILHGNPPSANDRITAFGVDKADNLYFGGFFEGTFVYPSDTISKRGGVSDGFFAKMGTPGCFVCPTTVAQFSSVDSFLKANFDASQSLEADSFYWDFDDGTTDTGISTIHTFSMDGSYNVCLIAKSDCDADTICQMITVADSMVGINELNSLEVSVYPNPSQDGVFTVRTEAGLTGTYELFDLTGRVLDQGELDTDGRTSIGLSDYAGPAVLRLTISEQGSAVRLLMRQ